MRAWQDRERPRFEEALATSRAKTDDRPRCSRRWTSAAEILDLVDRYRRAKADAGVMDFSDQDARWAPGWASAVPEVAEFERAVRASCCSTSTRTPRSLRGDAQRLFSGAPPGRGHPVTAVGDPPRGSTAGAALRPAT